MRDDLLRHYRRELTSLRKDGAAFAERYPKIASRLELGVDECADPHIERLLEGFAFLSGRVQNVIESELPLVSSSLLGILYPHFLCPTPSLSVARFTPDPAQGELTTGHLIPRHTPLLAEARQAGLTCRFRTCYPVTLWPLDVADASFQSVDQYDFLDSRPKVAGALRIRLAATAGPIKELALDRLRFFLDGERMTALTLYELMFCACEGVVLLPDGDVSKPRFLPASALSPVGFADDEDVIPYEPTAHPAYRLLQEYFAFPEKYLFCDLDGLEKTGAKKGLDILVLLSRLPAERLAVDAGNFRLGCAPVANLFPRISEPIRLDHTRTEYRLVADARRERFTEVHSIAEVASQEPGEPASRAWAPYFSVTHQQEVRGQKAFWLSRRVPHPHPDMAGTDLMLSFVDLGFTPALPPVQSVFARVLCTNRHAAEEVPMGAALAIERAAPLQAIRLLRRPTLQLDPPLAGPALWRLISHLSLNHLSLSNTAGSLAALKEILTLYSGPDDAAVTQQIAGLRAMSIRRTARRAGRDAWRGFVRGTEVALTFDENLYVGASAFLLAAVLNRFLALYAGVNSFTRLTAYSMQRQGVWKQWPPMAGDRPLL